MFILSCHQKKSSEHVKFVDLPSYIEFIFCHFYVIIPFFVVVCEIVVVNDSSVPLLGRHVSEDCRQHFGAVVFFALVYAVAFVFRTYNRGSVKVFATTISVAELPFK